MSFSRRSHSLGHCSGIACPTCRAVCTVSRGTCVWRPSSLSPLDFTVDRASGGGPRSTLPGATLVATGADPPRGLVVGRGHYPHFSTERRGGICASTYLISQSGQGCHVLGSSTATKYGEIHICAASGARCCASLQQRNRFDAPACTKAESRKDAAAQLITCCA